MEISARREVASYRNRTAPVASTLNLEESLHQMEMTRKSIVQKIEYFEIFFANFDNKLRQVEEKKQEEFDSRNLNDQIANRVELVEAVFSKKLEIRRTFLLNELEKQMRQDLNDWNENENIVTLSFLSCKKNKCIYDCNLLVGSVVYKNKFSILKKLKYMDYLNQLESKMELVDEQMNQHAHVRALILAENKLFIYLRTQDLCTFFKIFSHKCKYVTTLEIEKTLNYKNILTLNSKIVCLFVDIETKDFVMRVYDDELNLLNEKVFESYDENELKTDLHLCSLSENEIICWDGEEKKCKVFDFDLNLINEFGQCSNRKEPFYFCNGILIESSTKLMLFYYYDISDEEQKHFIKIINRETGLLNGIIDINFECFSRIIHIDTESNILLRSHNPNNQIKYFDSKGNLIGVFSNTEFSKFNRIDLTKNDELICFDKRDNKIFFL